jgi:hypothetical protein
MKAEEAGVREVWVPVRVKIWTQGKHYLAVIRDEQDVGLLSRYVNKPVVLKIGGIYVEVSPYMAKHGKGREIHMQLPKKLKVTWEILRRKSVEHDAVVIMRVEDDEAEVV